MADAHVLVDVEGIGLLSEVVRPHHPPELERLFPRRCSPFV